LLEAPHSSNDMTQTADVCDVYLFFNDLMNLWNPPWHFIISCCIHHVRLSRCDARQVENPLFGSHCVLSSDYPCVNPALYWTEVAMTLIRNEAVDKKREYCQFFRTRQKGGTKHLQVISRVISTNATKSISAVTNTTNCFIAFQSWLSRCLTTDLLIYYFSFLISLLSTLSLCGRCHIQRLYVLLRRYEYLNMSPC
jgi:hypothetical protein